MDNMKYHYREAMTNEEKIRMACEMLNILADLEPEDYDHARILLKGKNRFSDILISVTESLKENNELKEWAFILTGQ